MRNDVILVLRAVLATSNQINTSKKAMMVAMNLFSLIDGPYGIHGDVNNSSTKNF